jgi:CNT family concentrative nucleoside transporter
MYKFQGLIGIVLILAIAYLFSNNKKRINYRLVFSGLALQLVIGILVLKIKAVTSFFQFLGKGMGKIEEFSREGAAFVYGGLGGVISEEKNKPIVITDFKNGGFVFAFNVTATIILVCVIVALLYHFRIMQKIVAIIAKAMNFIMRVSGAEALSNVASAFVGQVEAQVMIRPYLATMTKSELLASMSGSLACIAGGILIVYANMGAQAGMDLAPKLITASLMAAPGALVIAKILFPETEESQTMGKVKLEVKSQYTNTIDAITHGASEGFKIAMNVIAMLIGFIALIALIDWSLFKIGHLFSSNLDLSLNYIFGKLFYPMAWAMGVPNVDVQNAATLLGQKLTINEFVAFKNLTSHAVAIVSPKGLFIVSIAICGFANFSSVGMLIGGIGELAPTRRKDLAQLGLKALLAGTLASYLSASIAGILIG